MKTFISLPHPYLGMRGRRLKKKGRLELLRIFEEEGKKCEPFWLIYIRQFDPQRDGLALNWFIGETKIISTAPGKHWLSVDAAMAHFEKLSPYFIDYPKRTISDEQLKRMNEARKNKRAIQDDL